MVPPDIVSVLQSSVASRLTFAAQPPHFSAVRCSGGLGGRALRDFAGLDKPMIYYAPKRCNGLGFLVEEVFKETRVI
jgi:hypothetical protein